MTAAEEEVSLRPLRPGAGSNPFAAFGKGLGFGVKGRQVCGMWRSAASTCDRDLPLRGSLGAACVGYGAPTDIVLP